jgi:hypothetical protein
MCLGKPTPEARFDIKKFDLVLRMKLLPAKDKSFVHKFSPIFLFFI